MSVKASICTIGDEILLGQICDTNSPMIAKALGACGINIVSMVSVPDDRESIRDCLIKESSRSNIVICTGGLGPTKDDITKSVIAGLSGSMEMVENRAQRTVIHTLLHSRGLDVLDNNIAQAMVPERCDVIVNRLGTAPAMILRREGCTLYFLPGVPFEAENLLPEVLDDIKYHFSLENISHRNIMTYGIAESALAKQIAPWEESLDADMKLAYLPDTLTGVKLRLSVYGGTEADNATRLEAQIGKLCRLIPEYIYSLHEDSLQEALGRELKAKRQTVSTAESCTGGEIAHLITSVPGSSAYFMGSVVSYAVSVKENVLGIDPDLIARHGVVSSEVAAAMAAAVKKITGSDFAVATTGYAGPGGGDEINPEGTVWVGIADNNNVITQKFLYHNDRERNIQRFAASALNLLLKTVKADNLVTPSLAQLPS